MAVLTATFSFAQVTIGTGNAVDSNAGLSTPVSNYYGYSLSQSIYLASEINATGNITSLDFQLNGAGSIANSDNNIDVWIGHTSKSSYSPVVSPTGADWEPITNHTQVMINGSLTRVGNMVTITFAQPFAYNGVDNLIITVDANEPAFDSNNPIYLQGPATAAKMSLMIRTDEPADNPNPLNMPLNFDGTFTATSVQAKNTRPKITIQGITALGVEQVNNDSAFVIYPNPVTSHLFFKSASNVVSAEVYTISGQLVQSGKVSNNSMDAAGLSTGTYIVKAVTEAGLVVSERFVKE